MAYINTTNWDYFLYNDGYYMYFGVIDMMDHPSYDQNDTIDMKKCWCTTQIYGGKGNDTIYGSQKHMNFLYGDKAYEVFGAPEQNLSYLTVTGKDTIFGGNSSDYIDAGAGNDYINAGKGTNVILCKQGDGINTIVNGNGNDYLYFVDVKYSDLRFERCDNDLIVNYGANDKAIIENYFIKSSLKGIGDMNINTNEIQEAFYAFYNTSEKEGIEILKKALMQAHSISSELKEQVYLDSKITYQYVYKGSNYNEKIVGSNYSDTIIAGIGNDTLEGGQSNDKLTGNKGTDTFIFSKNDGVDIITDADNNDKIQILNVNSSDLSYGKNGNNLEIYYDNTFDENNKIVIQNYFSKKPIQRIENIVTQNGNVILSEIINNKQYSITGKGTINGTTLNDNIIGSTSKDTIKAGNGNDTITGGKGNDTITGGTGLNTVNYTFGANNGNDTVNLTKGENFVLNISGATVENLKFKYANNNKDLVIYISDSESITLKNFGSKDVTNNADVKKKLDNTSSVIVSDGTNDIDLRTDLYLTGKSKIQVSKNFSGTWLHEEIDASGYVARDKKGNENFKNTKGLTLKGNNGDGIITGSKYNDTLQGGNGDDTITGGKGNDNITGGAGLNAINYTFGANNGNDTVNLTKGENFVLNISGATVENLKFKYANNNKDLVIYISDSESITLKNFGSKDVTNNADAKKKLDNTSSVIVSDGKNDIDLRTDLYLTGKNKIQVSKDFSGTWLHEEIDALGYVARDKKGNEIVNNTKGLTIKGNNGDDIITGSKYNDTLQGGNGDDTITGGRGNDNITGGAGLNTINFNVGDGQDVVNSDKGEDTLQFNNVDLALLSFKQGEKKNNKDLIIKYSDADQVTVKNYYTVDNKGNITGINSNNSVKHIVVNDKNIVFGTSSAENFVGTNEADYIYGEGGNDNISSGMGNDYLYGGEGSDVLNGEQGNDYLYGGKGNDTVNGNCGDDSLDGGYGSDTFVFRAGDGQDIIEPSRNGLDNDVIKFTTEQDLTYHKSSNGNDLIIKYNNGQDSITLKKYFESSSSYPKTILNGTKILNLDEELSSNYLIVEGSNESEYIYGINADAPKGNDIIYGYGGDDIIYGGSGEDIIIGGTGDDTMSVYNNDTFVFNIGDGNDVIDLGLVQTKEVKKATIKFNDVALSDLIFEKSENDIIIKYSETDSVILKNYLLHTCYNLNTPNSPEGSCHYNLIDCYGNNELISDMIKVNISGEGNIYGTIYDDIITGSNSGDNINAGAGNDVIYAGSGENYIYGKDGNDIIYGGNDNMNYIHGDAGDDIIHVGNTTQSWVEGGSGNDVLYSGNGTTNLTDGSQTTYLYGGEGNDTYIIEGELLKPIVISDSSSYEYYGKDVVEFSLLKKEDLCVNISAFKTNDSSFNAYDLYITNENDFGKYGSYGLRILNFNVSNKCSIDKIVTADSYCFDLKDFSFEEIRNWLIKNNFDSTSKVFSEGTKEQIAELKNILNSAWKVHYDDILGSDGDDNIQGTDIGDKILANNGNDTVDAKKGNDIIDGGSGNNKFEFSEGDGQDTIINGDGSDTIQFDEKVDLRFSRDLDNKDLILNYGNSDTISLQNYYINNSHSVKTIINGSETLTLNDALNKYGIDIVGTASIDNIVGTDGNDTIYAGHGNDIIDGGKGNDTYIFERVYDGNDEIAQGSGEDTIKFLEKTSLSFTRYLNDLNIRNSGNDFITLKDYYLDNGHCVKFIQNGEEYITVDEAINRYGITVVGTSGNDIIKGSNLADSIDAKRGNDIIDGLAGDDTFIFTSGDGKDIIIKAGGDDIVKFSETYDLKFTRDLANNDLVIKYGNSDSIILQDYYMEDIHSVKTIQNGEEVLTLEEAINNYGMEIKGSLSGQTIEGTFANDTIIVAGGNGIISKGAGQDVLKFEDIQSFSFSRDMANNDLIINGVTLKDYYIDNSHSVKTIQNGEEILTIEEAINKYGINIIGTDETEEIMGSNGNDTIYACRGDDIIYGLDGNDYIDGYSGGGIIYGGNGNDEIYAPSLDSTVYGDAGDDIIVGGAGNTTIYGGAGNDTLSCSIANTFVFNNGDGHDIITSYSTDSTIKFADSTLEDLIWMRKGNDLVIGYNLLDGEAQDTITIKNYNTQYKDSSVNKTLYVVDSNDVKKTIPDAIDYLTIDYASEKNTTSQYNVRIVGTNNSETLLGNEGNDIIIANGGDDELIGSSGNDTYVVSLSNNQTFISDTSGSDTIIFSENKDNINFLFDVVRTGYTQKECTNFWKNKYSYSFNYNLDDFSYMFMLDNDNIETMLKTKNFEGVDKVGIYDYFNTNIIETITDGEGYTLSNADLNAIRENVQNWLDNSNYCSTMEVLYNGSTSEVELLLGFYQVQSESWNAP